MCAWKICLTHVFDKCAGQVWLMIVFWQLCWTSIIDDCAWQMCLTTLLGEFAWLMCLTYVLNECAACTSAHPHVIWCTFVMQHVNSTTSSSTSHCCINECQHSWHDDRGKRACCLWAPAITVKQPYVLTLWLWDLSRQSSCCVCFTYATMLWMMLRCLCCRLH